MVYLTTLLIVQIIQSKKRFVHNLSVVRFLVQKFAANVKETNVVWCLIFEIQVTVKWGNTSCPAMMLPMLLVHSPTQSVSCIRHCALSVDSHCTMRQSCDRRFMEYTRFEYCDMLLILDVCDSRAGAELRDKFNVILDDVIRSVMCSEDQSSVFGWQEAGRPRTVRLSATEDAITAGVERDPLRSSGTGTTRSIHLSLTYYMMMKHTHTPIHRTIIC